MYKKILFLTSLCISTHILAMEPEKNICVLNWRSKCVPVKSSQIVPSQYSFSFQKVLIKAIHFNDIPVLNNLMEQTRLDPAYHIYINTGHNDVNDTPLHLAANLEYPNIVRILLKNGALPNAQNKNGTVPLSCSLANKNIPCIELLLEYGADQTIKDIQGDTPIYWLYKNPQNQVKDLHSREEIQHILKIHALLLCDRLEKL